MPAVNPLYVSNPLFKDGLNMQITTVVSGSQAGSAVVFLFDATSGSIVHSLPDHTQFVDGATFFIKKIDTTTNTVTLVGSGSANIDGSSTATITQPWTSLVLILSSSNWYIV